IFRPEMSQEATKGLVAGKKEWRETSIMDLPDNCLTKVIDKLDLASSLKLRLNKRLNGLQMSVKNKLKSIKLELWTLFILH
ncbi:hypothetical protein PENTCL1PPCAC_19147, partial [Pristionchus entomophagus]